ncbi:MAG: type II toxin-antitoxin system ParD family antitoxin [Methanocella sp.]
METRMALNVNLGTPYEAIIEKIIKKGYAGNQTEVIRQALTLYEREIDEEEARLVDRGVEAMMADIETGKVKTYTLEEVKKKQARKRGL